MKLVADYGKSLSVGNEVYINLENEILEGNVLDAGVGNHGIIYNLCKGENREINIDYIDGESEKAGMKEEYYDTLVLFFTFGKLGLGMNPKGVLKETSNYLREGGNIIIWDADKRKGKGISLSLNVILPGKITKRLSVRDFNLLREYSGDTMRKLLAQQFEIIEFNMENNIYYIKATKKGRTKDENRTSSG